MVVMLLLAFVVLGMDVGDSQGPAALGFAQAAKKVRRKRRRFDAAQAVKDMKDTWQETMGSTDVQSDALNCDQAIDELLLRLPDIGSLFYALVNGWYLGEWADYSSCLADAADSQYVLATVRGSYKGAVDFTRGGEGKYTDGFTTRMGLCFPKQCTIDEVRSFTEELILGYASGVGWKDATVDYEAASVMNEKESAFTGSTFAVLGLIALILGAAGAGTLVELSPLGDKEEYRDKQQAELLQEASKFRRLTQYDAVLLQRKTDRARTCLLCSMMRNGVLLNIQPRGYRNMVQQEMAEANIAPEQRITKHLKVFNGLKGGAVLLVVWGITFQFAWFSVVSNPEEVGTMSSSWMFNIVSATVYTVPVFFFCSAFLQTMSFMQKDERIRFTPAELGKFYLRKIFRYMPLNALALLFVLFVLPFLASGPIWSNYKTLVGPCSSMWWTNVLWLNNLYPRAFDDKCLPWTWFIPCYIQLSLLLPPVLALSRLGRVGPVLIAGLALAALLLNLVINY